jgi:hypothetical protein
MLALSAAAAAAAAGPAEPASPAAARVVTGELTRVDLGRRSVSVKPDARDAARADGGDARELEAAIGPETRFISRGRAVRLEDLRPGDRVVLVVGDEGGRHLARVVKVVGRTALAAPSPANSNPPATSAASG